jgi:nicotinamidase-related amidase
VRTRLIVIACAAVAVAVGVPSAAAPRAHAAVGATRARRGHVAVITALAGAWVRIRGFYGVNYGYAGATDFAAAPEPRLLEALRPATLRFPGGDEADQYDWRSALLARGSRTFRFTLRRLAQAARATGAVPIFDLNLVEGDNSTNPSNQIAMLESARRLGFAIRYVELGNELYAGSPHGARAHAFPTATQYGRAVAIYVKALHARFPGVLVAADAVLQGDTTRELGWNAEMLRASFAAGHPPDAVILHDYPGEYLNPFVAADVPGLFATISSSIAQLAAVNDHLRGLPVWVTEYNFRGPYATLKRDTAKKGPNPVQTSFARELYEAAFAAMLPRVAHVKLADNWSAFAGGPAFAAWADPAHATLTASGQAVEMVDTAAAGARWSSAIRFRGAAVLPGGAPAIVGQAFRGPGQTVRSVIVNLSGNPALVRGRVLAVGASYEQVAGTPTTRQLTARAPRTGSVRLGGIELPAYSVTLVGASLRPMPRPRPSPS